MSASSLSAMGERTHGDPGSTPPKPVPDKLPQPAHRLVPVDPALVFTRADALIDELVEMNSNACHELGRETLRFLPAQTVADPLFDDAPMLGLFEKPEPFTYDLAGGTKAPRRDLGAHKAVLLGRE